MVLAFSVPPLEDFTDNVEVADPGAVINDKDIERGAAAQKGTGTGSG